MVEKRIDIRIAAKNLAAGAINQAKKGMAGLGAAMKSTAGQFVVGLASFELIKGALRGLTSFVRDAIGGFMDYEKAVSKLRSGLKNVTTATEGGTEALLEQADALQIVTGYSNNVIINAQGMLSTFQMNEDQIKSLTPRLLDMAASLEKTSGEEQDLQAIALAMGKAMTMGTGALSRYGIVLTEVQRESFNTAEGMDKVRVLGEILDGNFKGLAKAAGQTLSGQLRIMNADWGDLSRSMATKFVPGLKDAATAISAIIRGLMTIPERTEPARKAISDFFEGWKPNLEAIMEGLGLKQAEFSEEQKEMWGELNEALGLKDREREEELDKIRQERTKKDNEALQKRIAAESKATDDKKKAEQQAKTERESLEKDLTDSTLAMAEKGNTGALRSFIQRQLKEMAATEIAAKFHAISQAWWNPAAWIAIAAIAARYGAASAALSGIKMQEGGSYVVDRPTRIAGGATAGETNAERVTVEPLDEAGGGSRFGNIIINMEGGIFMGDDLSAMEFAKTIYKYIKRIESEELTFV